jgi:hypothetical protein
MGCTNKSNILTTYALPILYVLYSYLSENEQQLVPFTSKRIGFYNRDKKCLQRGTDWAFK